MRSVNDGFYFMKHMHEGKQQFLDYLEWCGLHTDEDGKILYEEIASWNEDMIAEFIEEWNIEDDLEEKICEFLDKKDLLSV